MNIHEIERLNIIQPDWRISDLVKDSLNNIAKPLDSLGKFEDIICTHIFNCMSYKFSYWIIKTILKMKKFY